MVGRDECMVPAWDLINSSKQQGSESPWTHLLVRYRELEVPQAKRELSKQFTCDYILANSDRHWNELGVIFDARSMRALRVAPIYDTGSSLWYDSPELRVPADLWYRPLPLIAERARRIRPEDQLRLIDDLDWFDARAADGFPEQARSILEQNPHMDKDRLDSITVALKRNIETVSRHARDVRHGIGR
jgi:hypothetical protein